MFFVASLQKSPKNSRQWKVGLVDECFVAFPDSGRTYLESLGVGNATTIIYKGFSTIQTVVDFWSCYTDLKSRSLHRLKAATIASWQGVDPMPQNICQNWLFPTLKNPLLFWDIWRMGGRIPEKTNLSGKGERILRAQVLSTGMLIIINILNTP